MTHENTQNESGFTLLELLIVVSLIAAVMSMAAPNVVVALRSSNESSAISSLKTVVTAQEQFRGEDLENDWKVDYAESMKELGLVKNLIDPQLATGVKSGYSFEIQGDISQWTAKATPVSTPGNKAKARSFFVDQTGVIRFAVNGTPDATSSPVGQ